MGLQRSPDMPTYEYKCIKCGRFDIEQSIKDKPFSKCPKCGGNIKRLISSSGIVFKGSGFHVTDYKKEGLHETKPMGKLPEIKSEVKKSSEKKKN